MNPSIKDIDYKVEILLNDIAQEEGLKDYKIKNTPAAVNQNGYLGMITSVSIIGKNSFGEERVIHLIVKTASKSDALRIETPLSKAYEREIHMYTTVMPALRKFETDRKLPSSSVWARCYKSCMVEKSETLVLENLKKNGYSLWNRMEPMEDDHVHLVMREYGRFHALSLAMRDQDKDQFKELTKNMDDIYARFMAVNAYRNMFNNQAKKALELINPVTDKVAYAAFNNLLDINLDKFFKSLPKFVDNYSVILHGDCWTTNMLFKYEDKNDVKKPTKMCMIDFQMSRLGPPIIDLSHYFFACASKNVLDNHEHYLNIYYSSLSDYLHKLGSDPEKVYPKSIYYEHWRKYSRFGLICSVLLIHVMMSTQDADFEEMAESGKSVEDTFNYNIKREDVYNDRVRHNIMHCVKNGYI